MSSTFDVVSQNNLGVLSTTPVNPSIAADGNLIAFAAVDSVTNTQQIFVKNESTSALTLVSKSSSGNTANSLAFNPVLSADGSSVGFASAATNLVGVTIPANTDEVYVKTLATGGLQLVSQTQTGAVANAAAQDVTIAGTGSIVAFDSAATNLNVNATGGIRESYVKNLSTGTLTLVSQLANGTIANQDVQTDAISLDGNFVVFQTAATDLGSSNAKTQIYVKNVATGALTLASETANGIVGDGQSFHASISSDGTTVVFDSTSTNLVAGASSGATEAYAKNLSTGAIALVSQKADGTIANGVSGNAIASADGKYVMFLSTATNLDAAATTGTAEVYVKNMTTGALTLLSKDSSGIAANNISFTPGEVEQGFSSDATKAVFTTFASNLANTPANTRVVLRDTTTAPALTISSLAGGNVITPTQASSPVTFSGTSDQIGQTVELDIDTTSNKIGTAVVKADGTWSITGSISSLTTGAHTEIATVQGTSYLSTTASQSFTIGTTVVPPALAFSTVSFSDSGTAGDGITNVAGVKLSGTVTDSSTGAKVEVFDGTTDLGTATINGSTWTLAATLGQGVHSAFSAILTDSASNSLTATNATSITVDTTNPAVTFNQGVKFKSATAATLTGTVSDNTGVSKVEIFDGTTDLGAAKIQGSNWTFAATLGAGDHSSLTAVAFDTAGNQATASPNFLLQTGIKGSPYTSYEGDLDSGGNLIGEIFTNKKGAVFQTDVITNLANGNHIVDYNGGSFFASQDFNRELDLFDKTYNPISQTLFNNDGSHSITGFKSHLQLKSLGTDVMTGGGTSETFVFTKNPGQETITDFIVGNPGHDTISLAKGHFSSVDQILQSLQQAGGDVLIDLGKNSSITIQNVTVADLQANKQDFKLHA